MQRVNISQHHERQFHTVRRDTGGWLASGTGQRSMPLAQATWAMSSLVDLGSHARWVALPQFTQVELVLLDGEVRIGDRLMACGDAACAACDADLALQAGPGGARVFARLSSPARALREMTHFSTLADDASWEDFCAGVRIKTLWDGGERRSLLVRMRAGARVGAHPHALEEECMMLAGEAFIGDTLLRSGEYQLAPAGSRHGALVTDVGALFYVHGALDPATYA